MQCITDMLPRDHYENDMFMPHVCITKSSTQGGLLVSRLTIAVNYDKNGCTRFVLAHRLIHSNMVHWNVSVNHDQVFTAKYV